MRKKMRRTYPRKQGMEYIHGGNKMLKLSLKQGQYVNIGDNIRVVYVGGSGNHARLLIDAPRELNIARSTTEENPARKRETYYAEPGISREAQQEIKRILWNERMKAEAKKDAENAKAAGTSAQAHAPMAGGCPGTRMRMLNQRLEETEESSPATPQQSVSRLGQWPCQIKLVAPNAPYFNGAKLLIAADCTAYAYARMHEDFMKGKVTLIGCPKLDDIDYSEKLTTIIANNDIQSVTIVRMEVPCCGGLEFAAKKALQASGKFIPWQVVTISIDGNILD